MSSIQEQITRLRNYANILEVCHYASYMLGKNNYLMCAKAMREAADTIEEMSAKVASANMERPERYYNDGWIPCDERLPEIADERLSDYVLLSFENYPLPRIGLYKEDSEGNGAFFGDDSDTPFVSIGLFVNAWRPLPMPYREI